MIEHNYVEEPDRLNLMPKISDLFSGIGKTGADYIYVWVEMSGTGFACVPLFHIENITRIGVEYVALKMPNVNIYSVTAIMFALNILVNDPDAIYMACREMLRAPQIVREINEHFEMDKEE